MSSKQATILSDSSRHPSASQPGDWHDTTGHHRYYGSSACNGGERLSETRSGPRPAPANLFGF
jgi:hypothetical protein